MSQRQPYLSRSYLDGEVIAQTADRHVGIAAGGDGIAVALLDVGRSWLHYE
jgi:hypothetical protein